MTTFSDTNSTQLAAQSGFDKNEGKEQDFEDGFQTRLRSFRRQEGSFWRSPLSLTASIEPLFPDNYNNSNNNIIARGDTIGSRDPSWRWRPELSIMEVRSQRQRFITLFYTAITVRIHHCQVNVLRQIRTNTAQQLLQLSNNAPL